MKETLQYEVIVYRLDISRDPDWVVVNNSPYLRNYTAAKQWSRLPANLAGGNRVDIVLSAIAGNSVLYSRIQVKKHVRLADGTWVDPEVEA